MSTHVPTHGAFSEALTRKSNTTHDRKGREGKGIGRRASARMHRHLGDGDQPIEIVASSPTTSLSMHAMEARR